MQPDIIETISRVAAKDAAEAPWRPEVLPADDDATWSRIQALHQGGSIKHVHDTLAQQLRELMSTRDPQTEKIPADELDRRAALHLAGHEAARSGVWVFYPWSGRLVHLLPEDEFTELRHSRNQNKITAEEQGRLKALRIGVVGLSVGQASAITLAMEGVGGEYRLADFDRLDLTNTNRIRAGVHDLGVHKAVLTARTIYELDPFATVRLFPDGLTDDTLDTFLHGGGRLDFLVEEADDLYMKIKVREAARAAGIPVIMETSDRGLVDVERFDREPDRPILHGLVGGLDADSLRHLSTQDKVPVVLNILDQGAISARMAASLVDVGTTLKTWPQLASAIALGAAAVTDAVRRMALGEFNESGRFYVDLNELIRDGGARAYPTRQDYTAEIVEEATRVDAPPVHTATALGRDEMRTLVHYATMAPSGGNSQPWRFEARGDRLRLFHDASRTQTFLDFGSLAAWATHGFVLENLELVAGQMGLAMRPTLFPDPSDPLLVAEVAFEPGANPSDEDRVLFAQIPHRVTNRRLGARVPFAADDRMPLDRAAHRYGADLGLVTDEPGLERMGRMLGRGDRVRFLNPTMHQQMMNEIRWTAAEVQDTRDGLDAATLELGPADFAGMRLTSNWKVMDLVGRFGAGRGLEKPSRKAVAAASAVGLVKVQGEAPEDLVRGGRALQRVWLMANHLGYAFQPMTAITYLFARLERGEGDGFTAAEREELTELREIQQAHLPVARDESEIMLFRLARAGAPTARSLRRPLDEVLTFV